MIQGGERQEQTTIFCDKQLRKRWWPLPLGEQWVLQYPGLFDFDDLRQAVNQPEKHFCEWYAAIHIFQRDGSISMVEKCAYQNNPVKYERYINLLSQETRDKLDSILAEWHGVQLPDLMVIASDHKTVSFAEVKGPGDRLHHGQPESHEAIKKLGFRVEYIEVAFKDLLRERDAWRMPSPRTRKVPGSDNAVQP
ncbi:MAG TPA: hypothetical protein DCQ30_10880 [Acidimicrobiaceae bacterium]|nr:hypothetical protein [Acidimicrobiaceae bacterium]